MAAPLFPERVRALLLDIEGTTTPVDFVYGVLFPFARARVEDFLSRHSAEEEVASALEALRGQREADAQQFSDLPPWRQDSPAARIASAAAYVQWLIDRDLKFTALKFLQGRIWESGYRSGELRGQVYPDVAPAFQRWRAQRRAIAIFSSGSVLAQKLLFAHSTAGDLTPYIEFYFDTTAGPKQDEQSYRRIAAALTLPPTDVLFLSDVLAELEAARRAGMETALCVRSGGPGAPAPGHNMCIVRTLDEVFPDS